MGSTDWQKIVDADFEPPAGADFGSLTAELSAALADPDAAAALSEEWVVTELTTVAGRAARCCSVHATSTAWTSTPVKASNRHC